MQKSLPIDDIKAQFFDVMKRSTSIVLTAEPGAGKSTRLPLWLLSEDCGVDGKIYLLQPRRVAVKNIAQFLALQLNEKVGESIGYRMRNETRISAQTKIEVITEGVLIQLMQEDPELDGVAMIIMDEFHERSLQADLAFGIARDIQQGLREDLIIMLMSATLALDSLEKALPYAEFIYCSGRSFPIEVEYRAPSNIAKWRLHALSVIREKVASTNESILVFLPGSGDIRFLEAQLKDLANVIDVLPLFGDMPIDKQSQVIASSIEGQRKLVLATNIAETSITIEGIGLVIDSGLENIAVYDEQVLTNKLVQRTIAKSSAIQRAGRAGRLAAGNCVRLFGEESFNRLPMQNSLPIFQADILPVVIESARWGVGKLSDLPLLDKPNDYSEKLAWKTLIDLTIVDSDRRLTKHGEQASQFPCHPRFSHMIIEATRLEAKFDIPGLTALACVLSGLLENKDILSFEQAKVQSDLTYRVSLLLQQWRNKKYFYLIQQIERLKRINNLKPNDGKLPVEYCGALLALAYPERISKQRSSHGEYLATNGKGLKIDAGDSLAEQPWLVAAHLTSVKNQLQIRLAAPVDIAQLEHWQLITFSSNDFLEFDEIKGKISSKNRRMLGAITVEEQSSSQSLSPEKISTMWLEHIRRKGVDWLPWQPKDEALLAKWRWINRWQAAQNLPNVETGTLLENLENWLGPYLSDVKDIRSLKQIDLSSALLSMLSYQQQLTLKELAPTFFVGPTGRNCPIRYTEEKHPIVSLPMQEVYGMAVGPAVGDCSNPISLTLELLSPAKRPIQITSDLVGFWAGSYVHVQKEMKAKYPKHFWPNDPANALPTNRTKKHMKAP